MIERVWSLWTGLTRASVEAPKPGEICVVVSPESLLCPPGWVGIVRIEGATLATVPDDQMVDRVRLALGQSDPITALEPAEVVGPAWLSYLDPADFVPCGGDVERLPVGHPAVKDLIARVDQADADEAGLDGIASDAFVVRDADEVISASGYRPWLDTAAHLSVLTAPGGRGQGLARVVASAAAADALDRGLVPQWRARVEPSRRVAGALGFREVGSQVRLRLPFEGD
ncbi:GNAT family N-acetyltransferase [Micromonospora soli]|uniref:GNAT family N-acetyltransferase n=1 Tax=Micromonospora sp. NBRC 110009 TaxID=3061627 RepID=UPI002672A868|nr:GNAT family N-acetyltransferase [Micromonospora sp. NBRC 110009]WKU00324.1 GNAT family N-acetyltransferase [Micromonospora sp. NBRC 110009]